MNAQAILGRLITLLPDFAAAWDNSDNYFREDNGSFSQCGVFAKFSHYFRESYEQVSSTQIAALGRFVSECAASTDTDLADAAATCFLENVAGERFNSDFRRHLSGEALRYYSLWDRSAEPGATS